MITDAGLVLVRNWIRDGTGDPPTHVGVGLGTTAPRESETVMLREVFPTTSRTAPEVVRSEDVIHFRMTMGTADGSTASYAEQGLFTANTGGTMFSRLTHPDTEKSVSVVFETILSVEVGSYLP